MMDPGPSPMLTNALPHSQVVGAHFPPPFPPLAPYPTGAYPSPLQRASSPLTQHAVFPQNLPQQAPLSPNMGRRLQNPYLQNVTDTTPLQRSPSPIPGGQEVLSADAQQSQVLGPYGRLGISSALMQNSQLRSASYASPLQRNASLYTNVLSPPEAEARPTTSVLSSSQLSSAMLNSQLRNASFTSPFARHLSPTSAPSPAPPSTLPQQGGGRGNSIFSGGLRTSQIQGSMFKLPGGTLTMSRGQAEAPADPGGVGRSLSPSALSNALLNPSLRQATYRLPDGTLVTRTEAAPASSPSSSVLSSAMLNANVRKASYRLPDGSILMRPGEEAQSSESVISSPGLSGALMNANLRKTKFQLPEGSSLFSRNQPQPSSADTSSGLLSGALLNSSVRGASYKLPNTSLLRQPGSADTSNQRGLDLSNALRNQNLKSATYRLPDGTLMTRPQPVSPSRTLDLSNALTKNPNLRGANYRLPDGNIMTRLGAPGTPEPRSLNLSGALQNPHLRGASFHLPSYAVVSPQVQGPGPGQHWAHGSGAGTQDVDVWGAERVLPHGTVQNLNKWSMYRDGELLDPHSLTGQGHLGNEPGEWNLSREGEPQGNWFDKVTNLKLISCSGHNHQSENHIYNDTL